MKADFSRLRKHAYLDEWLQQQGRVWLDSDWNEAALSRRHQLELQVEDVVGAHGRPEPGTGFLISAITPPPAPSDPSTAGDFAIGGGAGPAGHIYLDGILAANPSATSYFSQPDYPHAPPLPLPSVVETGWQLVGDVGTARAGHTAAALPPTHGGTGPQPVLVCGGWSKGVPTNSAERYDPGATTWSATGAMSVARLGHTATTLANGKVLITGGMGGAGLTLGSAELYDSASGAFTSTGSMATPRAMHTATLLRDGRVLVCGGFGQRIGSITSFPSSATLDAVIPDAEIYDPAAGTWSSAGAMNHARAMQTAVLIPAGAARAGAHGDTVLVAGGHGSGTSLSAAEIFDPASKTWKPTTSMHATREAGCASVLADGRVLVAAGASAGAILSSSELFDPESGNWASTAPLLTARANHISVRLNGNRVLVAGGYSGGQPLNSAELYDAENDSWQAARPMNEARSAHTAIALDDGSILVVAGTSAPGQPPALPGAGSTSEIPSAELYHPAAAKSAVAYLEVWRRLITYLQDDEREIALGGPDTTVRLRTVAQLKVVEVAGADLPDALDCTHAAAYLPDDGAGLLSTFLSDPSVGTAGPCDLSDDGTYAGGENRLYRVEIHDSGEMLGAQAPADLPLTADAGAGARTLQVAALTAGQITALGIGRWDLVSGSGSTAFSEAVSITDAEASGTVHLASGLRHATHIASSAATLTRHRDGPVLTASADAGSTTLQLSPDDAARLVTTAVGPLARPTWLIRSGSTIETISIGTVDELTGGVTLASGLGSAYPAGAELVRRATYKWSADNACWATQVTQVVSADTAAGTTTVQLASIGPDTAHRLRAGDVIELIGDAADLRTGCGWLGHVTSDPDPDALTVVVDVVDPTLRPANNTSLVADHLLLRKWDGTGFVTPTTIDLGAGVRIQFSGYDFCAASYWWFTTRERDASVEPLSSAAPNGIARHRMPLAVLRWLGDATTGVTLDRVTDCVPVFDPLTHLQAKHVSYDDSETHLGATNVQDAIEALAGHAFPKVAADGVSWRNDSAIAVTDLNAGLTVSFTEPMDAATLCTRTFEVWLRVPDATEPLVHLVQLPGTITPTAATGGLVKGAVAATYKPSPPLDPALVGQWRNRIREIDQTLDVRADIVLKGDKILDLGGTRALDGNVFARTGQDAYTTFIDLRLPSGDGKEGGDFESWVFLSAPAVPAQVSGIEPAADSVLTQPPQVVHVMFSKDVQRSTITSASVTITDPTGTAVAGTLDPFPFDANATIVSGITFTPTSAQSLATPGQYQVTLLGTGAQPIIDTDGMPLDGLGNGTAGDYTAGFIVLARQRRGAKQAARKATPQ
jgi:hypothetical protein